MIDNSSDVSLTHWQLEMLQSIDAGLVVLDRQYRIMLWNSFMENHSCVRPDEAKGQPLFELFPDLPETWLRRKIDTVFKLKNRSFTTWEQRPYIFKFANYLPLTGNTPQMYQNMTIIPLPSITTAVDHVCLIIYDVTDMAASKLQMEQANRELSYLSQTDGLTGLYNRSHWETLVVEEFERFKRTKAASCLVMVDIDDFREVNNNYGHPAGDEVLRNLAAALTKTARTTDRVGRYGGEEFGALLINTDSAQALYFAERLRKNVEKAVVEYNGEQIRYTISVGITELNEGLHPQHWLQQADKALYASKAKGRNQSTLSGGNP